MLSLGPRRPYKASCSLLGSSPAAAGPQYIGTIYQLHSIYIIQLLTIEAFNIIQLLTYVEVDIECY